MQSVCQVLVVNFTPIFPFSGLLLCGSFSFLWPRDMASPLGTSLELLVYNCQYIQAQYHPGESPSPASQNHYPLVRLPININFVQYLPVIVVELCKNDKCHRCQLRSCLKRGSLTTARNSSNAIAVLLLCACYSCNPQSFEASRTFHLILRLFTCQVKHRQTFTQTSFSCA